MVSKRNFLLGTVAIVGFLLTAVSVSAQDYSAYRGMNDRTGKNAAPDLSGPGRSRLLWFTPNALDNIGGTITVNNTALFPNASFTGNWLTPPADGLAGFIFDLTPTHNRDADEAMGAAIKYLPDPTHLYTFDGREPGYLFTSTIAGTAADPTVKQNAIDTLSVFTWTLDPTKAPNLQPAGVQRNYALYVWLPVGPTGPLGNEVFPQRYFVYDVLYGTGQRWIEVVDSYRAGPGWVRIGNGGRTTNKLFHYDGTNPIQIRLYNTVPRDQFGNLTDTPGSTVVYADAARAIPEVGSYTASPTVMQFTTGTGTDTRTVAARNDATVSARTGLSDTVTQAVVTSYIYNTGQRVWTFTPAQYAGLSTAMDNDSAGVTQNPAGSWTNQNTPGLFTGVDYLATNLQNVSQAGSNIVTYSPTLDDGDYDIQVYLGGDTATETYGRFTTYEIHEGATVNSITVDQSRGPGWFRIGTRRYTNKASIGEPLSVVVTNYSADAGDVGRKAYTDAIRFLGSVDLTVTSTPVQATAAVRMTPGGTPVDRPVVVIPAEDGHIYCVDALGNGNGTTNLLWVYPSLRDSASDPNQVATEDGVGPVAEMPTTGFGKSSGLVQRIGGQDFFFIGASNGRVYCIDMAGRGDMNLVNGTPGTTRRVWSYPDDFPKPFSRPSALGDFVGSVAFGTTAAGPTIFAPTTQGRMYALDAVGVAATKTTTVRWAYPATNQPTLGEIQTTPALDFGNVYFGTLMNDENPGQFFALNQDTGAVVWSLTGTTKALSDFEGGATTVSAALLGGGMPNTVFVANDNLYVYALDAAAGTVLWETNELNSAPTAPLTYTPMTVFNNTGSMEIDPIVLVPTMDGHFDGLFARVTGTGSTNRFGTKLAYQYNAAAGVTAELAVGRGWMYGADNAGNLYAFNDDASNGGQITPGVPPGNEGIVPNNPAGDAYREAKVNFITKEAYQRLRLDNTDPNAVGYAQVLGTPPGNPPNMLKNQTAFEWGETVYMIVYDFPYTTLDVDGNAITEPVINFTISTDGAVSRQFAIVSRQWKPDNTYPTTPAPPKDGYAILAFPIQGAGPNSLPPGGGKVTISITTSALNNTNTPQQISPIPGLSAKDFQVANPLAIAMRLAGPNAGDPLRSVGFTTNPSDPQNLVNGNPDVNSPAFPGNNESLLGITTGLLQHGGSGTAEMFVVDRSAMTLLRGPGHGLDNVRVERRELAWEGGAAAVLKPIPGLVFPNFEDLPELFPNISLDYPNIQREQIKVTKDPNGTPENPVFNGTSLLPPLNVDETNLTTRTLVPTPFDFTLDVPRFQPPNFSMMTDSSGALLDAGYLGRMRVFVDSDGSGTLSSLGGRREAFRSFNLGSRVGLDESLAVRTPVVDLGSLPSGAGYDPLTPGTAGSTYNPWDFAWNGIAAGRPEFREMFAPIVIENTGNVNDLNVRLAKATTVNGGSFSAWPISAAGNDVFAWLDGYTDSHANFDKLFGLMGDWSLLQKGRVGDRVGTDFLPNPYRRENANLGVLQGPWNPNLPTDGRNVPKVSVSLPLGFPVGLYSEVMRIIEDYNYQAPFAGTNGDEALNLTPSGGILEAASDPTFILRFTPREDRLTNSYTRKSAPMIDDPSVLGSSNFSHTNLQPAAVRAPSGSLLVAVVSNRASFLDPQPADASLNDLYKIFIGTVDATGTSGATNPLRDLKNFVPNTNSRWFRQSPATANGYPSGPPDPLFLSQAGETVLPATVKYGAPALPTAGFASPFSPGNSFGTIFMAFLGEAQKQTSGGRVFESRLMVAPMSVDAAGNVTLGAPDTMPYDAQISKGKPSIVQVSGTRAVIFYPSTGTGQSQIFYTVYDTTAPFGGSKFSAPKDIGAGAGFESVSGPSGSARLYSGVNPNANARMIELTLTGKLRGRPNNEVFYARMGVDGTGTPNGLEFLPVVVDERLAQEREAGVYRADGVQWNQRSTVQLVQLLNGVRTNLEVPNTRVRERSTGLITFDTVLGGKAYIDGDMGTVRFSSGVPNRNAQLLLTYQPRIFRASANTASGFVGTSLVFDNRISGDLGYWARPDGSAAQASDSPRPARLLFTYNRAAAGAGQTARPFMRTMRLGIQLANAIYTAPDGSLTLPGGGSSVVVTGNTGFYQVDPAHGRIYFEAVDEDRPINVTFAGINESSAAPIPGMTYSGFVGIVSERLEQPLPIEQVINETGITSVLDPFDSPSQPRPGLIWMFWSSTRTGSSDVYFETIAPRFTPVVNKK